MYEVIEKRSGYNTADKFVAHAFATKAEADEFAADIGGKVRALRLTPAEQKRAEMLAKFGQTYTPKRAA